MAQGGARSHVIARQVGRTGNHTRNLGRWDCGRRRARGNHEGTQGVLWIRAKSSSTRSRERDWWDKWNRLRPLCTVRHHTLAEAMKFRIQCITLGPVALLGDCGGVMGGREGGVSMRWWWLVTLQPRAGMEGEIFSEYQVIIKPGPELHCHPQAPPHPTSTPPNLHPTSVIAVPRIPVPAHSCHWLLQRLRGVSGRWWWWWCAGKRVRGGRCDGRGVATLQCDDAMLLGTFPLRRRYLGAATKCCTPTASMASCTWSPLYRILARSPLHTDTQSQWQRIAVGSQPIWAEDHAHGERIARVGQFDHTASEPRPYSRPSVPARTSSSSFRAPNRSMFSAEIQWTTGGKRARAS